MNMTVVLKLSIMIFSVFWSIILSLNPMQACIPSHAGWVDISIKIILKDIFPLDKSSITTDAKKLSRNLMISSFLSNNCHTQLSDI